MKNGSDIMVGRIGSVENERFELVGDDAVVQSLQYAWVARIKNHMTGLAETVKKIRSWRRP